MRISDLISVQDAPRTIDLASVRTLLSTLDREGADVTLGTATRLRELLGDYVTGEAEPVDVLRVILSALAAPGEGGGAFLVRGPAGAGKSHLLAVIALLLQHPLAWRALVAAHPSYADIREALSAKEYLVVPIPLAEHRAADEHLEDALFDHTEQALRDSRLAIAVPLSEQSHALSLIDRHIVPRYSAELDAYTHEHVSGRSSWKRLRDQDPGQAVQTAREFARGIGYPLDFRQSRVERLSRLLEIVRDHDIAGIVWLLDDLGEFLAGVAPKAAHGDCSFLDFIGQRCKIAPLFIVATLDEGLEQATAVQPYVLNAIRTGYRTDLLLTREHMRTVARRRVIDRPDPDRHAAAMSQIRAAYQDAFGAVSFSEDDLAEAYPLHPTALRCLESIATRFFGAADTLVGFMQELFGQTNAAGILERDYRHLLGIDDVFDYLRPRIASHPEVSAYLHDVLDYYQKNAAELCPAAPDLCVRLTRALITFRLASIAAPLPLIAEALGLDPDGRPAVDPALAEETLEAMRLGGTLVDVRRGAPDAPPIYVVDVQTSMSETVRRRILAAKGALDPDDPRLWRHVFAACDDPTFPLAQLAEERTLEVQWQNTFRCISAALSDLVAMPPNAVGECVAELADPATVEDVHLFVARLHDPAAQAPAWDHLCTQPPSSRWSAAVLAWIPRELSPQDLDTLKEFACVADLLQDERNAAEPAIRDQLTGIHTSLLAHARRIVRAAYYDGDIRSPFGRVVASGELAAFAGNWSGTLQAIAKPAFDRVFPDFPAIAPRRPLVAREQIDILLDKVIRPGAVRLDPGDALKPPIENCLQPLGLVTLTDDECAVDVASSKVAADVMARVRQRDQTPQHELGRPLSCSDLAQHLVKSPLGLPPELFEVVVGALLRTGYLVALRGRTQLVRFEDLAMPLSGSVQFVARPPLLSPADWQVLSRVSRIILDAPLPGPDHGVQMRTWERLIQARSQHLEHTGRLRERLEAHIQDLGHRPSQWRETLADIDLVESCFNCIRPELHPAIGLPEFIADVEDIVGAPEGTPRLTGLFRRITALGAYLDGFATEVIAVRRYLLSPEISIEPAADLDARREAILNLIESGEEILAEEANLRRQTQILVAAYKRRYLSWHGRVYRSPVFDQYRSVHQSPEMRALTQLSKLHIDVDITAEDVARRIDAQADRRCTRPDLSEALDDSPVCPDCGLRLGEEPELLPVENLLVEIAEATRGYIGAFAGSAHRSRLADYAAAMDHRGDLSTRIDAIIQLGPDPSPREIITLFTDDVITHINRVLSGKRLAPRNFAELRTALEGRTLSKQEAQVLFRQWLEGDNEELEDDGLLQIDA